MQPVKAQIWLNPTNLIEQGNQSFTTADGQPYMVYNYRQPHLLNEELCTFTITTTPHDAQIVAYINDNFADSEVTIGELTLTVPVGTAIHYDVLAPSGSKYVDQIGLTQIVYFPTTEHVTLDSVKKSVIYSWDGTTDPAKIISTGAYYYYRISEDVLTTDMLKNGFRVTFTAAGSEDRIFTEEDCELYTDIVGFTFKDYAPDQEVIYFDESDLNTFHFPAGTPTGIYVTGGVHNPYISKLEFYK